MKRFIILLIIYILIFASDGKSVIPISPDIHNRGHFHLRKGEEFIDERAYQKALRELERAYEFSFDREEGNNILKKKVIVLIKLSDYEGAIKAIEGRELGMFDESEFLYLKVECLQRLNKIVQAIKVLDDLIANEKIAENKISFEIKEGLLYLSLDSLDKAEETFTSALETLQKDEDGKKKTDGDNLNLTMYSLGYISLRRKAYEDAEKYFRFLATEFQDADVGYKSLLYLGLITGIKGDEKGSMEIFKSLDLGERSEVSVMKGYLLFINGSYKQAKAEFQSVENDTQLNEEILKVLTILAAECSYALKEYTDAVIYFRKYISMVTDAEKKMPAVYGLAWSYYRLSKYSNVYAVLKDFLILYPDSPYIPEVERLSALSLFYVGEHAQAKYHFTRLLNLDENINDKDRIYYLRGKSEFYLREFSTAESDFNRIISSFPNSRWASYAMNMIARISFEKEDYFNAYKTYKELLTMEISASLLDEVRLQAERCLLNLGYYRNPVEMSRSFVRKYPQSPKSVDLQLEVAEYYFQLQKYWEAIREYERFLNLFPLNKNNRSVLFKLARSYSFIAYYEKALEIYQEISTENDEYAESALVSMGDIFFSNKQYKESIEVFKELTRRFPESNEKDYANFIIGKNYLDLNLPKEARVSFELVVKSSRVLTFKDEVKLLIARTLYLEGKGEEYIQHLNNLVNSGSRKLRAESYFLKAEYKKEMGRFKEAMGLFRQASYEYREDSDKVRAFYEAGLAAEELMLFDKALGFYEEAISISPIESGRFRVEERIKRIEVIKGRR